MVLAIANQIRTAHGLERFTQQWPVVGVVVTQEGLVQTAALFTTHDVHAFFILITHLTAHLGQGVAA